MQTRVLFCLCLIVLPTLGWSAERNIIFFITDDESPTLGCYGDRAARTPAIDAIAADGLVFSQCIRDHGVLQREQKRGDERLA